MQSYYTATISLDGSHPPRGSTAGCDFLILVAFRMVLTCLSRCRCMNPDRMLRLRRDVIDPALPWFKLSLCPAAIALARPGLARNGDYIAQLTGLSRSWIGLILLATATSRRNYSAMKCHAKAAGLLARYLVECGESH